VDLNMTGIPFRLVSIPVDVKPLPLANTSW